MSVFASRPDLYDKSVTRIGVDEVNTACVACERVSKGFSIYVLGD